MNNKILRLQEESSAPKHVINPRSFGSRRATGGGRWKANALIRQRRLETAVDRGSNHDLLEKTRILRDVIDPDVLADEPALADSRWAQYGYFSAIDATEEFTRLYVELYAKYRAKYLDHESHPCPIDAEFILNDPGTMSALYCARQFADSLGLPYGRFLIGMFERLMTVGLYRRVPLPSHLFPPKKPRKRTGQKAWKAKSGQPVAHKALRHGLAVQEEHLPRCEVLDHNFGPEFLARNFVGDPAQERALRAFAEHPSTGPTRPHQILRNRIESGRISVDNALRLFPQPIVDRALDGCSLPEPAHPDQDVARYRPHCLGLIQQAAPAAECATCDFRSKCERLAKAAEVQQMEMTGYANRRERERVAARDRKRAERARKKDQNLKANAGADTEEFKD